MGLLLGVLISHRVVVQPLDGVVAFRAAYEDGEAVAHARVEVLDPAGRVVETLRTDAEGRVVWVPPVPGAYTFRVVSPSGHGVVVQAGAITGRTLPISAEESHDETRPWRIATGALLVWALLASLGLARCGRASP